MYTLENPGLAVSLLDPRSDLKRCGARYCVGGYIYQVTDAIKGELLAGPQHPDPFPNVLDGQGAPDMFETPLGLETAPLGGEVAMIGVGRVRRSSDKVPFSIFDNPQVIEFLPWSVTRKAESITMQTEQTFQNWAYRLLRQVTLADRKVLSRTEIENRGQLPLPVRWFAHPFFPLTEDGVQCRISLPISLPENPGYFLNAENFICRKPEYDWTRGCYQLLEYDKGRNSLVITQRHPAVGQVSAVMDFMPTRLAIWGNPRTFSFEPYFEKRLDTGQSAAWSIEYQF